MVSTNHRNSTNVVPLNGWCGDQAVKFACCCALGKALQTEHLYLWVVTGFAAANRRQLDSKTAKVISLSLGWGNL